MDYTSTIAELNRWVNWQFVVPIVASGAVVEQVLRAPWLEGKGRWQRSAVWAIKGFLPEFLCIQAALFIPGALPEGTHMGIAVAIGFLGGTMSSKIHTLVLKKIYEVTSARFSAARKRRAKEQE